MLLLILIAWAVGIPIAVLTVALVFAWWCDRQERRRDSMSTVTPARVYEFMAPRSRAS
jgi:hypothetical protein